MNVTFLGTGSAMPSPDRAQTGLLVDGDETLLVDCGSGVLGNLAATDAGYEDVDALLLSHHHTDHVSDLIPLLKARWLAGADDLEIVGPPGTRDLVDGLLDVHDYLREKVAYDVREIETGEFSVAGFDGEAVETAHSMRCFAYRLDGFAYSADTEASEELAAFADGVDLLVHDCSFPDGIDVSNHPTPRALGDVLAGHDYGTVYLTHLYPHTRGHEDAMIDSVNENYDGEVRIAQDGETVEL